MKTTLTKALVTFLMLTVLTTLSSCFLDDLCIRCEDNEPTLVLTSSELTLSVDGTEQISITNNVEGKNVIWYSDNEEIVTVDENGIITAHTGGIAKIIAKIGKLRAICNITVKPDVFIAGATQEAVAVVWKNGVAIPQEKGFEANSVFVKGKNIFAVGSSTELDTDQGNPGSAVWKNGEAIAFKRATDPEGIEGRCIAVSDSDEVYAVANYDPGLDTFPILWKINEPRTETIVDYPRTICTSISLQDGDIYMSGIEETGGGNDAYAILWKNNSPIYLSSFEDGVHYEANSVFTTDSDVYAAGSVSAIDTNTKALMWKNGTQTTISDDSYAAVANDIYVSGDDVYVVGSRVVSGIEYAVLWKNGTPANLSSGTYKAVAESVFVFDNDVYVVGYETVVEEYPREYKAKLWKNGAEIDLGSGRAYDIFIR